MEKKSELPDSEKGQVEQVTASLERSMHSTPPSLASSEQALTALPKKQLSFYLSVLSLGAVSILLGLDITTLPVALPIIARQLGGTTFQSFWANISFTLAVAVTQPIYSTVSDVVGRKPPFYFSMVLFTCGCIIFALASDMNVVIVGRLFMGLGMGGLDVLQVIILSDITTLRERPLYWGINAIFITLGAASGPLVAGALSEYASWRWLGWINLPIIGIAGFLAIFFLNLKPIRIGLRAKLRRLDWIGMVFYVVGTTFFTAPLSWGGIVYPWSSWKTLLPLLVGVTVLASLIVYEKRAVEPVFPYRLFNNITAIAAIISGFVHGLLMYTFCQYLPLFFQAVFLQTPLQAAISTLPYNIVLVVFSALSGVAVNIARRYCIFLWIGWLLTAVFFGLMCSLDSKIGQSANYAFQAMLGLSLGTVLTVTAIPMQASVKSVDDTGLAAGMLVIFRIFGSLLGLSISSNLFSFVFARNFTPILAALPALEELRSASEAVSFIPSLRLLHLSSETLEGILHIYQKSFQSVWILMTCFAGAGFLVSLLIKELTLEKDDIGRQGLE